LIVCHSVSKEVGRGSLRKRVIDSLDWIIPVRSQIVILGQRGSGKTTLLHVLAGLQVPTKGWVERRGSICPPGGFLRYGSPQSSPKQLVLRLARLYGVGADELLAFVKDFSELGPLLDFPMSRLRGPVLQQLNFALVYGMPCHFYLFDGSLGNGQSPGFRDRCLEACNLRRAQAGLIFATSNPKIARQIGGDGAIIHDGKVSLYPTLEDAITAFESLPPAKSGFGFEEPEEQQMNEEDDDELF